MSLPVNAREAVDHLFERSVLVAAHPDDEVLWFSSVLERVSEIVFCFLSHAKSGEKTAGRLRAFAAYPRQNIRCLELEESGTFWDADWHDPVVTAYGMAVEAGERGERYKKNFTLLLMKLEDALAGCKNVFTHNPWGEYGHNEHVQVYLAVRELQQKMGFTVWVSSYWSGKSYRMMRRQIAAVGGESVTMKTAWTVAEQIKDLYERNECWTWYRDYTWPTHEAFMRAGTEAGGHLSLPLNLISIDSPDPFADELVKREDSRHLLWDLPRRLVRRLGKILYF